MAKRFTDTEKWKKPLLKSMPCCYKLLWLYICDDCDHAGIWQVDLEVASLRIGEDFPKEEAEKIFAEKIVVFDKGHKWFIPGFIEFQYGELNEQNRAHQSVIKILRKYKLLDFTNPEISPLQAPYVGAKDKDKDKEQDKDFEKSEKLLAEEPIVPEMAKEFKKIFPKYPVNEVKDFTACYEIAKMIGEEKNLNSVQILSEGREYVLKRWSEIIQFIKTDKWYSTRSLSDISKEWQRLIQTINSNGTFKNKRDRQTDASAAVTSDLKAFREFNARGQSDSAA